VRERFAVYGAWAGLAGAHAMALQHQVRPTARVAA